MTRKNRLHKKKQTKTKIKQIESNIKINKKKIRREKNPQTSTRKNGHSNECNRAKK